MAELIQMSQFITASEREAAKKLQSLPTSPDRWVGGIGPPQDSNEASLGRDSRKRILQDQALQRPSGLGRIPVSGVRSRPQGSAMNGPAKNRNAGPPLTPRPGWCRRNVLDNADATIVDALRLLPSVVM